MIKRKTFVINFPIYEIFGLLPLLTNPSDSNTIIGRSSYNATTPVNKYLIQATQEKAAAFDAACMVTEFGNGTDTADKLIESIRFFDERQLSWIYWNFRSTELTEPVIGNLLLNPALSPEGFNLDQARLTALVEPYPQAIAGTPISYHYDCSARIFTLTYTSKRADGCGLLSHELLTQIYIPKSIYPAGYIVEATGATVISGLDSSPLLLQRGIEAEMVTIKVAAKK